MKNELAKLFLESSSLLIGTDWLLKSFTILLLACFLSYGLRKTDSGSSTRHLLWMYSIICLGMLPFVTFSLGSIPTAPVLSGYVFTLNTFPEHVVDPSSVSPDRYSVANLLLFSYLLIASLFVVRILGGLVVVFRICRQAGIVAEAEVHLLARKLARDIKLSRNVELKISEDFTSPFSCGVFFPKVILPQDSVNWPSSTLESVLLHELMHIKRLDWLTMLTCHLITCLYWINPLCWFALKRLKDEAESSCDSAVLAQGLDAKFYAESLVYVARNSRDHNLMLVQMMAGGQQLSRRINKMFDGSKYKGSMASKFHVPLILFCFLLIAAFSNLKIVTAKSVVGNTTFITADYLVPIQVAVPEYPSLMPQARVSGSHIMYFTIMKNGSVDPRSIGQVTSAPANAFFQASRAAVSNFKFEPPFLNGVNSEIPNVRIRVDYNGKDESVIASLEDPQLMTREYLPQNYFTPVYPLAALESEIEGHVLVEFTISQEGKASDIAIVDRGPSGLFNESALAATHKLEFKPRLIGGVPTEVLRVQYMFRYELGRGKAVPHSFNQE